MKKIRNLKSMNVQKKTNSGITLIVLTITIVVILILAGTTTGMLIGQGGIIQQSKEAQNAQKNYSENEEKTTNSLMENVDEELKPDWKDSSGANIPKLGTGMVPVKWNGSNWIVTNSKDSEWFDYSKKQWANIMLRDGLEVEGVEDAATASLATMRGKKVTKLGSMFVWIPRYAYQIESGYHQSGADINPDDGTLGAGIINIEFMKGTSNVSVKNRTKWDNASGEGNWNIHPAFDYGGIVEGIWVAKFEASRSDANSSSAGSSSTLKIQPGVQSWRSITIDTMYTKCLNYDIKLNSHLMKSSEWGAVAYLAQSTYGKNSEVWINPNSNYLTGQAGASVSSNETTSTYSYDNTTYGVNASTTGNITGIYDLNGGSWEYVAAYIDNGVSSLTTYCSSLVNGQMKTKDIYNPTSSNTSEENYLATASKYGDAIYETSGSTGGHCSWYNDGTGFPFENYPILAYGGTYLFSNASGLFWPSCNNGSSVSNIGFRPVLIVL